MPFCIECGANVPENVKFCTSCGKAMAAGAAAAKPAAPPVPPPVYAPTARPAAPPPAQPPVYAPQPVYAPPPVYGQPAGYGQSPAGQDVIGVMGWIGMLIVMAIPLVGLIVCLVWAFGGGNANRRNFARACLILSVVGIILGIVFSAAVAAMFQSVAGPYMEQLQGVGGGFLNLAN